MCRDIRWVAKELGLERSVVFPIVVTVHVHFIRGMIVLLLGYLLGCLLRRGLDLLHLLLLYLLHLWHLRHLRLLRRLRLRLWHLLGLLLRSLLLLLLLLGRRCLRRRLLLLLLLWSVLLLWMRMSLVRLAPLVSRVACVPLVSRMARMPLVVRLLGLLGLLGLLSLLSLLSLLGLVCLVGLMLLLLMLLLLLLLMLLLLVMGLLLRVVLMLLLLLLLLLLLARVPRVRLLVRRMRLLVLLRVRDDGLMLDRLADAAGEHHRRRVRLGLHLLPRWRGALPLDIDGIGDMAIGGSRRGMAVGHIGRRRGEKVLRIGAMGWLLRRVALRLVRRRGVRRGRLLVCLVLVLVLVRVRRGKGGIASEAGLREVEAGVGIGPRRSQARHCAC